MAVRKSSVQVQKTLNDLKREHALVAHAIDQLESLLEVLQRGGAKRRCRPKKVLTKATARTPAARPGKKKATRKPTRVHAKKSATRRGKRASARSG